MVDLVAVALVFRDNGRFELGVMTTSQRSCETICVTGWRPGNDILYLSMYIYCQRREKLWLVVSLVHFLARVRFRARGTSCAASLKHLFWDKRGLHTSGYGKVKEPAS